MKKVFLSIFVFLLAVLGFLLYLVWRPNVERVTLDKQADIYMLTSEGVASLSLDDNQLKELGLHKTDLAHAVSSSGHLIDQRYWLFNEHYGILSPYVYSLDLKAGKLRREPSKSRFYNNLVMGQKNAYQLLSDKLAIYDTKGNLLAEKSFESVDDIVAIKDGLIYARTYGDFYNSREASNERAYLYIFKEDDLSLVDKISLLNDSFPYGYVMDTILLDDKLYYTVSADYNVSGVLAALDLKTQEVSLIATGQDEPQELHISPDGKKLFIGYDSYESNQLLMTVLDLETGQQDTLNLSEDLLDLTDDYPSLNQVFPLDDERLLLATRDYYDKKDKYHPGQLYLYDVKAHKVLSQLSLDKAGVLGFVKNPNR